MNAQIRDITVCLPQRVVTNEDLRREHADWNLDLAAKRTGVHARHVAAATETALDLGRDACQQLLALQPDLPARIDALIFCTQSADYIMPPNACVLHKALGLPARVMAFDINLACSGFVYALSLAHSMIRAETAGNVLLVNADTYSRYIHPQDRSARLLFGDGAAATWVAAGAKGGVRDVDCCTDGSLYEKFFIPAGGCRTPRSDETRREQADDSGNVRSLESVHMAGRDILGFVTARVPKHVTMLLQRNGLAVSDVDLFVFHQASAMVLDSLARTLRIDDNRIFRNAENIGNTVSASIPIAIKDAVDSGRASRGDTLLLSGFGVGLSWGSALLELV
jgi:3-oxoacyl-[acyl-carrier-protein] synthase-3